jgi:hypothetical protein
MGLRRSSVKAISAIMLTVICGTAATGYAAPAKEPGKEAPKTDPRYEELRKRGNKAAKERRFAEAIEVSKDAYAIHPSYQVACAIGRTEMLGQANALGAALWLTRCVSLAPVPERTQKDGAKELEQQQQEIVLRDLARARVGALRVLTEAGASVEVDGISVGEAPLDDEVFVTPGAHRVTVALGRRSRSVELKLAAGEGRTVDLSVPPVPPVPPVPERTAGEGRTVDLSLPPLPELPERTSGAGRASNDALFYAGLGVGAVGLGLTLGFGAAAIRLRGREAEASETLKNKYGHMACATGEGRECVAITETSFRADAFTAVSLISLSAVLAGGAMTTYAIFQPHRASNEPRVQAAFVAAPNGGSLFFTGQF